MAHEIFGWHNDTRNSNYLHYHLYHLKAPEINGLQSITSELYNCINIAQ